MTKIPFRWQKENKIGFVFPTFPVENNKALNPPRKLLESLIALLQSRRRLT